MAVGSSRTVNRLLRASLLTFLLELSSTELKAQNQAAQEAKFSVTLTNGTILRSFGDTVWREWKTGSSVRTIFSKDTIWELYVANPKWQREQTWVVFGDSVRLVAATDSTGNNRYVVDKGRVVTARHFSVVKKQIELHKRLKK